METFVLAGGCFWCLDAVYRSLDGVADVVSGYTGGRLKNPSYEAVCTGMTGHAEAVEVTFDPDVIPREVILDVFFTLHDPRQLNRQGNDVGTQYRSAMFYDGRGAEGAVRVRDRAGRRHLGRPDRHAARAARRVLPGRGVPPGLLRQEPEPGLLPRRGAAQGEQGAQVLRPVRQGGLTPHPLLHSPSARPVLPRETGRAPVPGRNRHPPWIRAPVHGTDAERGSGRGRVPRGEREQQMADRITVVGALGTDPEERSTSRGAVVQFRVASTDRRRDAQGNWSDGQTSWYRVNAWGELGRNALVSLRKGQRVIVAGDLVRQRVGRRRRPQEPLGRDPRGVPRPRPHVRGEPVRADAAAPSRRRSPPTPDRCRAAGPPSRRRRWPRRAARGPQRRVGRLARSERRRASRLGARRRPSWATPRSEPAGRQGRPN